MLSVDDIGHIYTDCHFVGGTYVRLVKLPHTCSIDLGTRRPGSFCAMGEVLSQTATHPHEHIQQSNSSHCVLAESSLRSQYVGHSLLYASVFPSSKGLFNDHIWSRHPSDSTSRVSLSSDHRFCNQQDRLLPQDPLDRMGFSYLRSWNHVET